MYVENVQFCVRTKRTTFFLSAEQLSESFVALPFFKSAFPGSALYFKHTEIISENVNTYETFLK